MRHIASRREGSMAKRNGSAPTVEEAQPAFAEFKGKEIREVLHEDEWYSLRGRRRGGRDPIRRCWQTCWRRK